MTKPGRTSMGDVQPVPPVFQAEAAAWVHCDSMGGVADAETTGSDQTFGVDHAPDELGSVRLDGIFVSRRDAVVDDDRHHGADLKGRQAPGERQHTARGTGNGPGCKTRGGNGLDDRVDDDHGLLSRLPARPPSSPWPAAQPAPEGGNASNFERLPDLHCEASSPFAVGTP